METDSEDRGSDSKGSITIDDVLTTVLAEYPSVTIQNLTASFRDGGLTEEQVETLYEHAIKRQNLHYRILAGFHGIKISDTVESSGVVSVKSNEIPAGVDAPEHFVFDDPKNYEKLSEEQRAKMTESMMKNHKDWVESRGKNSNIR